MPPRWNNLEMLVFEERGKLEYLEKNLSEQGREPTTNYTFVQVTSCLKIWICYITCILPLSMQQGGKRRCLCTGQPTVWRIYSDCSIASSCRIFLAHTICANASSMVHKILPRNCFPITKRFDINHLFLNIFINLPITLQMFYFKPDVVPLQI